MTVKLINAAVLRAPDAPYAIEQVRLRDPGPGEVLVKIAGAGMCHTDLLGRSDLVGKPVILDHLPAQPDKSGRSRRRRRHGGEARADTRLSAMRDSGAWDR